ncbi:MAG: acyl-CoA dehydrogenase [Myxococcales bacterium]|nr:acyl-CoA dehydrogenase [Myxococcales bacterium]
MAQAINRYRADLRDFRFLFFEQFDLPAVLGKEPYAEWGTDECNMVLDEVYRFVCEVTGPLNASGDAQGCRIEDGRVITPDGFKEAWDKTWEAGWRTIASPSRWGGQDAPAMVGSFVEEMMCGANTAFALYTGLTLTAAELIMDCATEDQKQKYVPKMMSGEWTGTMCLTEPQAGSDVGAATTSATRNDDGTYNIRGTKIFISAGDNDLGTNVVHLVLARIEGAEAGTKGLSLFLVPRVRINEDGSLGELNDVEVPSIEHKMGINASATCVVQFGDEGGSIGEVVGGVEHQGIRQMFHMMNAARIGVGIQGLSVASAAYLSALEYARERKQGANIKQFKDANAPRVPIIEHPNIRRDLLAMKARVEGIRALVMKLSNHGDRLKSIQGKDDESEAYHKGQVDLLTPLVKAYGTDAAFEVSSRAIQVYGGHGFLKDHPVEQYCRDAKIFQIYEGTNFIQSMDLVSRKLGQGGGANTQAFLTDIQSFITENKDTPEIEDGIGHLQAAHEAVAASVMQFIGWFKGGKLEHIPLAAEDFLNIMSDLAIGWLLLDQAAIALKKLPETSETHPDHAFYTGKKFAAQYFANNVLSTLPSRTQRLSAIDTIPVEIPDAAFATV